MNTPEPCDKCKHLYYDALQKDNPVYLVECKIGRNLGDMECEFFVHWKVNQYPKEK